MLITIGAERVKEALCPQYTTITDTEAARGGLVWKFEAHMRVTIDCCLLTHHSASDSVT